MTNKTIRRDWLKRQIAAGRMEIRCRGVYTDDYSFDAAVNFQRNDGWAVADIANFNDEDFRYSTGYCFLDETTGIYHWGMLCNHYYELRLKAA
jgi:hypothetical protein